MGKSNRIRARRANETVKAPSANKHTNKKKGMPNWLITLITVVITVAILGGVALSLLTSAGIPNRLRTSMKSEHFTVNTNMMSYYFFTTYQNFLTQNESYLSYFSLDTAQSLKKQPFGGNPADTSKTYYDKSFLGSFEGTWFDYFVNQTKSEVTSMLIYLEEANARGITLTDEEKNSIKASLDATTASMSLYYSSPNAYFSDAYGKGVSKSDVLKAMEYSTLASKAMSAVTEELEGKITDEVINSTYNEKKKDFDIVDYSYYSFRVDFEDIAEETLGKDYETKLENNTENQNKVLEAYKAAIAKAQADAAELAALTDAEAFKKAVLQIVADEAYDDAYETNKVADSKGDVTDEDMSSIRAAMIADALAHALETEHEHGEASNIVVKDGEETATAFGKKVPAALAKLLVKVQDSLSTKLTTAQTTYIKDKVTYTEQDEFCKWAFEDGREVGNTKIQTEGDGEKLEEITADKADYTYVSAYLLRSVPHKDEDKTRNVVYSLFSSENAAKAMAEALKAKGTFDEAVFEELSEANNSTGHSHAEDCYEGMLGSTTLDAWLFDDELKVGAFSETPIKLDDSTWCIAYYQAEGEPTWKVTVKSTVLNENFSAYYTAMEGKYAVTVKDGSFKAIDA